MVCSICSGALVLAEAGLLEGQEATSHWATAGLFRDHYPAVRFCPERILCNSGHDGKLVTTGGASSWQDLALYLIGQFCGAVEAARIARLFVIGDRSEGQLPFDDGPPSQSRGSGHRRSSGLDSRQLCPVKPCCADGQTFGSE